MAKLKRETRTETVKPIGIVQMSGMRDAAKGLMETSKTAQEFQQFFTSYGAEQLKKKAQEDASSLPSQKQRRVLLDDKNEYIPDSDGNPVQAEFYTPIEERDVGPFGSAYNESWNKAIAQRNLNAARETATRALSNFEAERLQDLDYKRFEAQSEAYIRQTVKDLPGPLRGLVEEDLRTRQNGIFINLQQQNRDRTFRQNDALRQTLITQGMDRLVNKLSQFGPTDPGALNLAGKLVDLQNQRLSLNQINQEQFNLEVAAIANKFADGAVINQIQSGFRSGDIEQSIASAQAVSGQIITGDFQVDVAEYDSATKSFVPVRKSIADIIPNVGERQTLAAQAYEIAYSKYIAIKNTNAAAVTALTNELTMLENTATQASISGDYDSLIDARNRAREVQAKAETLDPQVRQSFIQDALRSYQNIQSRVTITNEEQELLLAATRAEQILGSEVIAQIADFRLDDMKSREEYIAYGSLEDRVAFLKGQAKILEDAYTALTKEKPGQADFFELVRTKTGTTDPAKNTREYAQSFFDQQFPDNNWSEQDFTLSIQRATPYFEKGIVLPGLVTELKDAIVGVEQSPERLQRAMKVFQAMDIHKNYLTNDTLKKQMGDEAYRTYKYIRNKIDVAGTFPTDASFLQDIKSVFNGEKVMSYKDLDRETQQGIVEGLNAELDRSFFQGQVFLSQGDISYFEDLPQLPPRMRDQHMTIALEAYEQIGGDAKSAGKNASQTAFERLTQKQWAYDDVTMVGAYKEWVEFPAQKQYSELSLPSIKAIVRDKLISSRADANKFHFLERGYGAGTTPGEIKTEVKLQVSRLDNNNKPIYKLVSRNRDLDPEMPDSDVPIDMFDDNGNLIEVDFRETNYQLKRVKSSIIAVDREIERLNNKSKIRAFGDAEEVDRTAEDLSALRYIRNAMTYYPENVLGLYEKGIDLQPIDIKFHDTAPLGQNMRIMRIGAERYLEETGCPPGFVNNGTGCVLERKPTIRLEDLPDLDPITFAPRKGANVVAEPDMIIEAPNGGQ